MVELFLNRFFLLDSVVPNSVDEQTISDCEGVIPCRSPLFISKGSVSQAAASVRLLDISFCCLAFLSNKVESCCALSFAFFSLNVKITIAAAYPAIPTESEPSSLGWWLPRLAFD